MVDINLKNLRFNVRILATISILILSSLIAIPNAYSGIPPPPSTGVTSFGPSKNLSNDSVYSTDPQVVVSGSKVYSVWTSFDGTTADILFKVSDNSGADFGVTKSLSSNAGSTTLQACDDIQTSVCRGYPQIALSGSNVYVIWQDNDGTDNGLFFRKITDDGATFSPSLSSDAKNLSSDAGFSAGARIGAAENDVHVVWVGFDSVNSDLDIFYTRSTDNGDNFFSPIILDNTEEFFSTSPDLAVAGDNVYVVWQEDFDGNVSFDIFFRASIDHGENFGDLVNLYPNFAESNPPNVAAVGDKVFVTWDDNNDGDFDILFRRSMDNGDTFDPDPASDPDNLSFNDGNSITPQISTNSDGTKVYLSWQDNSDGDDDILFLSSTDSGDNFFGVQNDLSSNDGASENPRMDASGDNVYVTWQDNTLGGATDTDIFFRSSVDGGATFSGFQDLSNDDGFAKFQQVAAGSAYVIWRDEGQTDPTTGEIMFRAGSSSSTDVAFDKTQYKLGDTATITVVAPSGGLLSVDVSSSVGSFTRALTEIGTTGVYTTTITFTTGSSDPGAGILKVKSGDSLTATFGAQVGAASIFPRTIEFQFTTYTLNDGAVGTVPVIITVTDQNSNTNPLAPETIGVQVTSTTTPGGLISPLTLTETGPNSGIFKNTNLIFTTGTGLLSVGDSLTVSQLEDFSGFGFTTNGIIDTLPVTVKSSTFSGGFPLDLTETDASSGFFTGQLTLSSVPPSGGNTIQVSDGDILSITYNGESTNGLVIPNTNNKVGALSASIGDTVTATYLGEIGTATINAGAGGGSGGGGISRAGFVVNAIAGLAAFGGGGSGGNSPPSFGQSSFAIIEGGQEGFGGILNDNDATTLDQTKTFKVGQKAVLRFDFTEGGGIGKIEHIGLYANVRDGQKRQDSDAYIYFDPLKSPQVTVHDPNGLFSEANFELLQMDTTKFVLKFDLTFAKPMAKSDLILESWNIKKWSSITKISNAIEVTSSGILSETESVPVKTFLEDVTDDQVIPVWVKSNAKWWSDNKIDNDNFISGLEYLVNEGIITVSLPEGTDNPISEMPSWIKSTAGWWADDMISEDEFVTAIEWLITNNIIQVAA